MSCIMANRMVLNCRKISRNVTCIVTRTSGRTVIVADDNINDDDERVTKEICGGRKEVLSVSEESGEGVGGLGIPTLDRQ